MWKQGIALKDHRGIALVRQFVCVVLSSNQNFTLSRRQKASNQPQSGGFSAAAGTQEGNKLSLMDIDTDSPEDLGFAKGLRNILELEDKIRHFAPP